jgi:hypothetical protein
VTIVTDVSEIDRRVSKLEALVTGDAALGVVALVDVRDDILDLRRQVDNLAIKVATMETKHRVDMIDAMRGIQSFMDRQQTAQEAQTVSLDRIHRALLDLGKRDSKKVQTLWTIAVLVMLFLALAAGAAIPANF